MCCSIAKMIHVFGRDELLLLRADAADASCLHHHMVMIIMMPMMKMTFTMRMLTIITIHLVTALLHLTPSLQADLLAASPAKQKMNPNHLPQNELCSPSLPLLLLIIPRVFAPQFFFRFIDVHSRFGARISETDNT